MKWQLVLVANGQRTVAALGLGLLVSCTNTSASKDAAAQSDWHAPAAAAAQLNPLPATSESISAGRTLYADNCLACHGQTGSGNGPAALSLTQQPRDLTSPAVQQQSDGTLFWKIGQGHSPMPQNQKLITNDDRWNIVNYLRTLTQKM